MVIHAKKISPQWRKCFEQFEKISGFEIMHQEEVDFGEITPDECWSKNLDWFHGLYCSLQNIQIPDGRMQRHGAEGRSDDLD